MFAGITYLISFLLIVTHDRSRFVHSLRQGDNMCVILCPRDAQRSPRHPAAAPGAVNTALASADLPTRSLRDGVGIAHACLRGGRAARVRQRASKRMSDAASALQRLPRTKRWQRHEPTSSASVAQRRWCHSGAVAKLLLNNPVQHCATYSHP